MVYLLCETDETYGLTPVCYYSSKQDAESVIHYIEAIRYDLRKLEHKLNEERKPFEGIWSDSQKTEWSNRWKTNSMWAENLIRSVHYRLREYYGYVVIEIEIGKTIGSIQ